MCLRRRFHPDRQARIQQPLKRGGLGDDPPPAEADGVDDRCNTLRSDQRETCLSPCRLVDGGAQPRQASFSTSRSSSRNGAPVSAAVAAECGLAGGPQADRAMGSGPGTGGWGTRDASGFVLPQGAGTTFSAAESAPAAAGGLDPLPVPASIAVLWRSETQDCSDRIRLVMPRLPGAARSTEGAGLVGCCWGHRAVNVGSGIGSLAFLAPSSSKNHHPEH